MSGKPNYFLSILTHKCPRCRKGNMFNVQNPYNLKHFMDMPKNCSVCGQPMELEVGFYYGTGYVSYALTIAFTVFNILWFWAIFGFSYEDNNYIWFLLLNSFILIVSVPWLMRLSRTLWLYFFVPYNSKEIKGRERG